MNKSVSMVAIAAVGLAVFSAGCGGAKEEPSAAQAAAQQHTTDDGHGHGETDSHAGHKH